VTRDFVRVAKTGSWRCRTRSPRTPTPSPWSARCSRPRPKWVSSRGKNPRIEFRGGTAGSFVPQGASARVGGGEQRVELQESQLANNGRSRGQGPYSGHSQL